MVISVITAVFHYLNGGIRAQRVSPRVRPAVKAHLSVLLALIALAKAAGYLLARYQLDTSQNGYVEGAGYTDVHARLPALSLLFWISLAAAVVLLYNIRRRGWTLPVLAVGVWAFVALVVGVIYPAILQALKVHPSQSTVELPYIKRNIAATRSAYALNNVKSSSFAGKQTISRAGRRRQRPDPRQHPAVGPRPEHLAADVPEVAVHPGLLHIPDRGVDRYEWAASSSPPWSVSGRSARQGSRRAG